VQADLQQDGIAVLRRLTQEACADGSGPPDLVCWPECSGGSYAADLGSLADPAAVHGSSRGPHRGLQPLESPTCPLLFGGAIYAGHPERPRAIHQSAILVDAAQAIRGRYHKRHLMPFGEYVPGSDWFPAFSPYLPDRERLTAGVEPGVLTCGGRARLGVMLCYEDMIPGAARSLVGESANVLVSLVNGATFKAPLALAEHRLFAQLRAVETRRCLLRCASTGETCVISPLGIVTDALPIQEPGALVAAVPLLEGRTLASRIGPLFPTLCWLAVGLIFGMKIWRRPGPRMAGGERPV